MKGFITEVLKAVRNMPKLREEFIILVTWERLWKQDVTVYGSGTN